MISQPSGRGRGDTQSPTCSIVQKLLVTRTRGVRACLVSYVIQFTHRCISKLTIIYSIHGFINQNMEQIKFNGHHNKTTNGPI